MLEKWTKKATKDKKMSTACSLWAHMAYLYKNVVPMQLNYRTVSTLLVSQIFLNVNYRFDAEVKAGAKAVNRKEQVEELDQLLGFPQTEIFDLFQKHRRKLLDWLQKPDNKESNEVMEAIVRVVTFTGDRTKPKKDDTSGAESNALHKARHWQSLARHDHSV